MLESVEHSGFVLGGSIVEVSVECLPVLAITGFEVFNDELELGVLISDLVHELLACDDLPS